MKDKKVFILPYADIIRFYNQDVIVTSDYDDEDDTWGDVGGGVDDTEVP